ncbi:uncharacterized protein LOC118419480 isoform X1 [Branchiostoma floridae]|uniref:Uncharacterized protein LOC118419480 isoform X1 n=1 Tax=Branchiostoma floridae TaxID=7739 RepID=A0A9J7LHE3_BRAFL|nr:uncharacterized protein LOC118419480 isoform X1 [Branchiostoma floridae]
MAYHANTVSYSRTMAYHAKSIRGLGWTLVVLGTVSTILGTAAIAAMASREQATYLHYIAGPVWSGLFVLITGILGVLSGKKPTNRCLIVAFMVLGIFTILSTFCSFGLAVSGAIIDSCYVYSPWHRDFHHDYVDYIIPPDYGYNGTASNYTRPVPDIDYGDVSPLRVYSDDAGCTTAAKALHGVSALLALAELVLGFVVSIMCCCGLCNTGAPCLPRTSLEPSRRCSWRPLAAGTRPCRCTTARDRHRRSAATRAGWRPLQPRRCTPSIPVRNPRKRRPWTRRLRSQHRSVYCVTRIDDSRQTDERADNRQTDRQTDR